MPIEPIKIPQNVQIEDRLIGPITLKQVFICMIGGGISFVTWNAVKAVGSVTLFNMVLSWTPLAIAAAFAFVRVQNISLLRLILLLVERSEKPTVRKFGPRTGISINIRTYFNTQSNEKSQRKYEVESDKFRKLSDVLDKGQTIYNDEMHNEEGRLNTDEIESDPRSPVNPDRIKLDQNSEEARTGAVDGVTGTGLKDGEQIQKMNDIYPA